MRLIRRLWQRFTGQEQHLPALAWTLLAWFLAFQFFVKWLAVQHACEDVPLPSKFSLWLAVLPKDLFFPSLAGVFTEKP